MMRPNLDRRSLLAAGAATLLSSGCATRGPRAEPLAVGTGVFTFDGWSGPPLQVHYHRPATAGARAPIAFIMHGASRNANVYRDNWIEEADARGVIVAAPEFDKARFPETPGYALGGYADDDERFQVNPAGPFNALEPLFDVLRARTGSRARTYALFGHSAGGQFIHRYVLLKGRSRAGPIIAANAGWYTMPEFATAYPYGLAGTGVTPDQLRAAFNQPMTILLGTADLDRTNDNFRKSPEADAQGRSRLERGRRFYAVSQAEAARMGAPFRWKLAYAPDVGHENGELAPFAADILFGPKRPAGA